MRKYWSLAFVLLGLFGCQNDIQEVNPYPTSELTEVELNGNRVYVVALSDSSAKRELRSYQISLKLQDRVWYDTLYLELPGKEVIPGEVIFTEAVVNDMGGAEFEVVRVEVD